MNFQIVRSGSHTIYRDVLFRFYLKDNKYCLVFNGKEPPFNGFEKVTNEIYTTLISTSELSNAFEIETRCIYRGFNFHVENNNGEFLRILIDDPEAHEKLNLEIRDRGCYQALVNISDLDMLWEDRSQSYLDISFPVELIHVKLIHLDRMFHSESDTSKF